MKKKFDFSGYATKNNLKCSDGRIIHQDAFKDQDGVKVPLVWQHLHNKPENILGHAILQNRKDGVYTFCSFNSTSAAAHAKELVKNGDITMMSIYANELVQKGKDVIHGAILEVSLVLSGANPGAVIDNLAFQHSDGSEDIDAEEAIIRTGLTLTHSLNGETKEEKDDDDDDGEGEKDVNHSSTDKTVKEIFDAMSDEQKTVVYSMLTHAIEDQNVEHSNKGGIIVKNNVFDNKDEIKGAPTLTHAQFQTIIADATKDGSLKGAILAHATEYGIENIDVLFPDAQTLTRDPDWLKREDNWVQAVLASIHKSPFSRIKSVIADMDIDTARAKGYITATEKKEIYFKAAKRTTTPTTVYVKQKLDRDDIIDVTDFDIVAMARMQLRTVLDEELAIAALVGDGRTVDDKEKIDEECIRPIWTDVDLYAVKELLTTKTDYKKMIKEIAFSGKNYKGSGSPVLYTTNSIHVNMLWVEDNNGRRIYESDATLCAALGVSRIVEISQLEGKVRTLDDDSTRELIAIKINLTDYNFGADKGGQVASFDDFDIDFNQYKYLMETRCSGALTKPKSAQIFEFAVVEAPLG